MEFEIHEIKWVLHIVRLWLTKTSFLLLLGLLNEVIFQTYPPENHL